MISSYSDLSDTNLKLAKYLSNYIFAVIGSKNKSQLSAEWCINIHNYYEKSQSCFLRGAENKETVEIFLDLWRLNTRLFKIFSLNADADKTPDFNDLWGRAIGYCLQMIGGGAKSDSIELVFNFYAEQVSVANSSISKNKDVLLILDAIIKHERFSSLSVILHKKIFDVYNILYEKVYNEKSFNDFCSGWLSDENICTNFRKIADKFQTIYFYTIKNNLSKDEYKNLELDINPAQRIQFNDIAQCFNKLFVLIKDLEGRIEGLNKNNLMLLMHAIFRKLAGYRKERKDLSRALILIENAIEIYDFQPHENLDDVGFVEHILVLNTGMHLLHDDLQREKYQNKISSLKYFISSFSSSFSRVLSFVANGIISSVECYSFNKSPINFYKFKSSFYSSLYEIMESIEGGFFSFCEERCMLVLEELELIINDQIGSLKDDELCKLDLSKILSSFTDIASVLAAAPKKDLAMDSFYDSQWKKIMNIKNHLENGFFTDDKNVGINVCKSALFSAGNNLPETLYVSGATNGK